MESFTPKQKKWLFEHVPYRVRAGIGFSALLGRFGQSHSGLVIPGSLGGLCIHHGIHQGRMVAIRWLIEFVGLKAKHRTLQPTESKAASPSPGFDFGIEKLPGGKRIQPTDPEAQRLAAIWDGCSKAVMHPTDETDHANVDDSVLTPTMEILINHLEATIYAPPNPSLSEALWNQWWADRIKPQKIP